jgi:hypothetical protein
MIRILVLAIALLLDIRAGDAAVLCAKRNHGAFNSSVKIREACKSTEVTLTPDAVGFCCGAGATTTSTSTSVTLPCPTTTTLGVPNCGGIPGVCLGPCLTGQTCTDEGGGNCACTGPVVCGGAYNACGGECTLGQSCVPIGVPSGCPSIGCSCQ